MFPNNARVANLLVAQRELVVSQADRARLVSQLGMLQRAGVECNRPRLLTAREGDSSVQAPKGGKTSVGNPILKRIRGASERG